MRALLWPTVYTKGKDTLIRLPFLTWSINLQHFLQPKYCQEKYPESRCMHCIWMCRMYLFSVCHISNIWVSRMHCWHLNFFGMIDMISTLWYLVGPVIDNFNLNVLAWSQEYEIRVCQLPNAHPKLSNKRARLKIKIFFMYIFSYCSGTIISILFMCGDPCKVVQSLLVMSYEALPP